MLRMLRVVVVIGITPVDLDVLNNAVPVYVGMQAWACKVKLADCRSSFERQNSANPLCNR